MASGHRSTSRPPEHLKEGFHIYLRDLEAGTTTVVNSRGDGQPVPEGSVTGMAISGDGHFAAFGWDGNRLSPTGELAREYVFVKNLDNGHLVATRIRPSGLTDGTRLCGLTVRAMSRNGRYVAGTGCVQPAHEPSEAHFLLDRHTDRLRWITRTGDGFPVLDQP